MEQLSEMVKTYKFTNGAFVGKNAFENMFQNYTIIEYMQKLIDNEYYFVTADEKNIYFELLKYYTKLNKNIIYSIYARK